MALTPQRRSGRDRGIRQLRTALAVRLAAEGVEAVEVPPQMTAQTRRRQRTRQKTDRIDALAIARITAREDDLPAPRCDEVVDDLRSLVFYRRELVEARTAEINRLHADLTQLRPGYHKQLNGSVRSVDDRILARFPTARLSELFDVGPTHHSIGHNAGIKYADYRKVREQLDKKTDLFIDERDAEPIARYLADQWTSEPSVASPASELS